MVDRSMDLLGRSSLMPNRKRNIEGIKPGGASGLLQRIVSATMRSRSAADPKTAAIS
jgi:hypothetical protein